jgi:hypothetical protein
MRDMKVRHRWIVGTKKLKRRWSKYSEETVNKIKELLPHKTKPEISKMLSIPYATVYSIYSGRIWTHYKQHGEEKSSHG